MQTDSRDPLNCQGSTDAIDATCPTCGEPIIGIGARGPNEYRAQCGHRLAGTLNALRLGGGADV